MYYKINYKLKKKKSLNGFVCFLGLKQNHPEGFPFALWLMKSGSIIHSEGKN